jgi:hypothetical protein
MDSAADGACNERQQDDPALEVTGLKLPREQDFNVDDGDLTQLPWDRYFNLDQDSPDLMRLPWDKDLDRDDIA